MNPAAAPTDDLRLPPERFYWSVHDPSSLPRAALRPKERQMQLGVLLEASLPVPLEDVHAAYHTLPDGRLIACAMERGELGQIVDRSHHACGPVSLPSFVDAPAFDPATINLLTGRFAPLVVRRLRARLGWEAAATVAVVASLIVVGAHRRTAAAHDRLAAAETAAALVVRSVLPDAGAGPLPPALRLTSEIRTLERTRRSAGEVATPADAAAELARILALWPDDLGGHTLLTDSVILTDTTATVTATVDSSAHAQTLAAAVGRAGGWDLAQPQVTTGRGGVRATITLRREERRK